MNTTPTPEWAQMLLSAGMCAGIALVAFGIARWMTRYNERYKRRFADHRVPAPYLPGIGVAPPAIADGAEYRAIYTPPSGARDHKGRAIGFELTVKRRGNVWLSRAWLTRDGERAGKPPQIEEWDAYDAALISAYNRGAKLCDSVVWREQ